MQRHEGLPVRLETPETMLSPGAGAVMTDPHNTPQARLMQALFGVMVTKCISAVASMDVADALKDGPLYYTDLAAVVGADQRALHRVMRMLVSVGIFDEPTPGSFGLNELSDLLRSDVHGSLRDMAVMITSESHWVPWGELENILGERQSTVSQQLARLRLDRLVATRRDGKTIYYSLADENVRAILDALRKAFCGPGEGVKAELAES